MNSILLWKQGISNHSHFIELSLYCQKNRRVEIITNIQIILNLNICIGMWGDKNTMYAMLFVKDYNYIFNFYTTKFSFVKITDVIPIFWWCFCISYQKSRTWEKFSIAKRCIDCEAETKRQKGLVGKIPALIFKVDDCQIYLWWTRIKKLNDRNGSEKSSFQ